MERQTLWIDGPLPGLNEIIGASTRSTINGKRLHSKYTDMKTEWGRRVHAHALEQNLRPVMRARFVLTWYEVHDRRDFDNVAVGTKFVLDGLQDAGVLANDGRKIVRGLDHRIVIDKARPGVRVEIIPM